MEGWIKLHRKMVDWEWYNDNNTKILFLHLLLTANHKDKKWQGQIIKRGQKITSLEHLAKETNLSVQQIRTSLSKLKSTNEITSKTTNKNTLVTILKYSDYQDRDEEDNTQNNIQDNNQITNEQQTNNKQITTNKNDKNEKNEKNDKNIKKESKKEKTFNEIIDDFTDNLDLRTELKNHLAVRKLKKGSLTNRAIELELKTLSNLSDNTNIQLEIVRQSIEKGWIGFFPVKNDIETNSKVLSGNPFFDLLREEGKL